MLESLLSLILIITISSTCYLISRDLKYVRQHLDKIIAIQEVQEHIIIALTKDVLYLKRHSVFREEKTASKII